MDSVKKNKVLIFSDSARFVESAGAELRSAGYEVHATSIREEVIDQMKVFRPQLLAVDLDTCGLDDDAVQQWVHHTTESLNCRILLFLRATSEPRLRELFRVSPTNFLAIDRDEYLNSRDLSSTVQKILSPENIFGMGRYLQPGTSEELIRLHDSREKNEVVERVAVFANHAGFNVRIAQGLAVVADELLTNAIYNAPTDDLGKPRYANWARTVPVTLKDSESVELRLACDGKRFAISATDPFGSLPPSKVLDYLSKCFRKGEDQIDSKDGGAGLGLYKLFNLLQHFVVNIEPHVRTETIGLLDVTKSYREFAVRGKSFNLFVAQPREGAT